MKNYAICCLLFFQIGCATLPTINSERDELLLTSEIISVLIDLQFYLSDKDTLNWMLDSSIDLLKNTRPVHRIEDRSLQGFSSKSMSFTRDSLNWKYRAKNIVLHDDVKTSILTISPVEYQNKNRLYMEVSEKHIIGTWKFRTILVKHPGTIFHIYYVLKDDYLQNPTPYKIIVVN